MVRSRTREYILEDYIVHLNILYEPEWQRPQEELVTDLMVLISSSGKAYGLQ